MKKTLRYFKSTVATIALLVGTTTTCYGSAINNTMNNALGEQAKQGLQLTNTTPEPETMLLLGIGLLLLAAVSRKGKKNLNL